MKKILITLAMLLLTLTACGNSSSEDQWSRISKSGVLKVGTEGTYMPMTYHDEKGELVGFEVEVARAIAEELGLKVEFTESSWDSLLAALDSNRIDTVINEVTPTSERREKYDFSNEYTFVHGVIITSKDNDSIKEVTDLKDKKAAQTLSSSWSLLAKDLGAEIVSVSALQDSIDLITSKRADFSVNSELAYNSYIKEKPDAGIKKAITLEDVVTTAIPVKKGEERFKNKLNEAIASLQEKGTLKEISMKYFGFDITSK